MPKKASIIPTSEYWIELSPVVVEAYFSFHSSKGEQALNNKMPLQDFYTLTFEGIVSTSWTPKLALRTPVTITLRETDQEGSAGGGFSEKRKGKAELSIWLKKNDFFTVCDYIKDGTFKYKRAFGKELFRGSAAIYSVDFTSYPADE